MYPEDDLRREFWQFVRLRAADIHAWDGHRPQDFCYLDEIEDHRTSPLLSMYSDMHEPGTDQLPEEFRYGLGDLPIAYVTLQNALLAFLMYRVLSDQGFPYSYEAWLRTVVLVVAQAQREPYFLTVRIEVDHDGELIFPTSDRHARCREFTMTLDGSWDCLSREAFETIKETVRIGR